jgi:hypothetical protein
MTERHDETRPEPEPAPAGPLRRSARILLRRIGTSNPFYVISALLVCLGLRLSFDPHARVFHTWALMGGMAGYTLLLAATACVLVRLGNVWEDVRTLLLLVVLMFLATSVTFDDILANDPATGAACYALGLLFAIGVSEGLLRGMRFSLPLGFRLPYYLILALFFLYPVALVPLLRHPRSPELQWALFGFAPLAGLVSLALLPAIRRGPTYVAKNGTPWRWPLYPWTLFVFLGLGVCARSYYLCWSMQYLDVPDCDLTIFGPYFLVPFLFAAAVLLLEIGLVSRSRAAQRVALIVPLGLLALAMVGHRPEAVFQRFLGMVEAGLGGTPLYLTLLGATAFYAFAAWRRVPLALDALAIALGAQAIVGPNTLDLNELVLPRPWPLLALSALQLALGLRRRDPGRCVASACCLVAAAASGLGETALAPYCGVLTYHLALGAALLIGAAFDGALARRLRGAGIVLLLLACLAATSREPVPIGAIPPEVIGQYPLPAAGVALAYGSLLRSRAYRTTAKVALGYWLLVAGGRAYAALRPSVAGLDQIAGGLASFVLAALISLTKAGVVPRWLARWRRKPCPPA